MANLFSSLSDNQTALLGCFGALSGAFLLLGLSFYSTNRKPEDQQASSERQVLEMKRREQQRKAA